MWWREKSRRIAGSLVVARMETVEFTGQSFAKKWPERLPFASIRNPELLVSGDVGVERAHGVESDHGALAPT